MNQSLIRNLLIFGFLLIFSSNSWAQAEEVSESSLSKVKTERRWDKRQHKKYTGWERLKPDHLKMQYAGGMGVLSTGIGWDYGKRCQWETDFLLGYVPNRNGSGYHMTMTFKQNYIPWSMSFTDHWNLEPFYCGLYFTTITGDQFWKKEPGRYPNKYYSFSTKIRPSLFIGQRFGFKPGHPFVQNIQLFYELNTNELYLLSRVGNKSLKFKDIMRLSFGLRVHIFKEK